MSVPRLTIVVCVFAAIATLTACTSDQAKARVQLCGDLSVPEDIESVRVVVYDQDRNPLREGVRELWTCPGPTLHRLPQTLEFEPVSGDVFVEVQGLKEGVPVIKAELRTTLGNDGADATVSLERSCMGANCAAGETCVDGKCELVALAARAVSHCPSDAPVETDAGSTDADASATDTDPTDTATTDAGSTDAGTTDAGSVTDPGAYLCPQEDVGTGEDASDDASDADSAEGADAEGDAQ